MKTSSSIHHVTAALITRQMRVPLTIYLLLIMCLIMALPHTQESLYFLLIHLPPPDSCFCIVSCSWLSPPHFPLKSPLPPKVSFLVWQYAHKHTSNLGPSHERKQVSLDFIFFTFKVLRKLTAKTVRKCSDYIYKTNHFTLFLLNTFVCKERHKTEEPFKHHQHYRTFQQSLERGNILNSSKFLLQFRTWKLDTIQRNWTTTWRGTCLYSKCCHVRIILITRVHFSGPLHIL